MSDRVLNVLIVEDSPPDVFTVRATLESNKFQKFDLDEVGSLRGALESLSKREYDLVLLDLSLPDGKGLSSFEKIRKNHPQTAVVILTGLPDEDMALAAVRAGAQDYLMKDEVQSKSFIRALCYTIERAESGQKRLEEQMRQSAEFQKSEQIQTIGCFQFDLPSQSLHEVNGNETHQIDLTPSEFRLIYYLARNSGRNISRQEIIEKAWENEQSKPSERGIDRHVSSLKRKSPALKNAIESVYGLGYCFHINP